MPRLPADFRISLKRRGGKTLSDRTGPQPIQSALLGPQERQAIAQTPRSHGHRDRRPDPPLAGWHDGDVRPQFAGAC